MEGQHSQTPALVFDFGLILQQHTLFHAGLTFAVVASRLVLQHQPDDRGTKSPSRPSQSGKDPALKQKAPKAGRTRREFVLAYGGRFDNAVAHYQFGLQEYLPACTGVNFDCDGIVEQLVSQEPTEKLKAQHSLIDICIGSQGAELIPSKIHMMTTLQGAGFKVFVDYSDDMTNMTEKFMDDNNVRFVVQVFPEEDRRILYKDRGGGSSQSGTYAVEKVSRLLEGLRKAPNGEPGKQPYSKEKSFHDTSHRH